MLIKSKQGRPEGNIEPVSQAVEQLNQGVLNSPRHSRVESGTGLRARVPAIHVE
jgi:hypothetical protein